MLRNIALITGGLAGAGVLALGLAAAGFGPLPPEPEPPPAADVVEAITSPSGSPGAVTSRMEPGQVLAALDAAGVTPAGRIVIVHGDGTVEELDFPVSEPAASSMDRLMQRLEGRLERGDAG